MLVWLGIVYMQSGCYESPLVVITACAVLQFCPPPPPSGGDFFSHAVRAPGGVRKVFCGIAVGAARRGGLCRLVLCSLRLVPVSALDRV